MPEEAEKTFLSREWVGDRFRTRTQEMEGFFRRVADKAPRREYIVWGLFLGLSCLFLWSAFFGPQGVVEFLRLRGSLEQLEAENRVLLIRNQALEKEVYLLRNSPSYQEKVAREEYGYAYEGEKVYTFSAPDPAAGVEAGAGTSHEKSAASP